MQQLTLTLSDPIAHLIAANLVLTCDKAASITLALPRWIPGSYLLRDFAKHLSKLRAEDKQGNVIEMTRVDLSRWQLDAPIGKVFISYELYAYDLSVRANYFCPSYAFINPAASALYVEQWREKPYSLVMKLPTIAQDWQIHTTMNALPKGEGIKQYQAQNYDDLIEHPLLIGKGVVIDWQVHDMPHRMVLVDEAPLSDIDSAKIIADLTAICSAQHDFWGNPPYPNYLFQVMVSADGYGGLEHINSTALMTSRASLPRLNQAPSKAYEDYLGLCSHEYFHAWLVKRIKPTVLLKPNLQDAVLTPLLWIFEGFTSLYDDWFLLRSGRINQTQLFTRWSDTLTNTLTTKGGEKQSLADSSTEAWIKFYQPNENTPNSGLSYYTRGAVVALLLLSELVQQGKHLDDLLKYWWSQWQQNHYQGLSNHQLIQDLDAICPTIDWSTWLEMHVTRIDINIITQLEQAMLTLGLELKEKNAPTIDAKLNEEQGNLVVKQVTLNEPAYDAGLQVGDELLAINGWRVRSNAQLEQHLQNWLHKKEVMALTITINHKDFLSNRVLMPNVETISYYLSVLETEKNIHWLIPNNEH